MTSTSIAEEIARMITSRVRGVVVVAFGLTIKIARTSKAYGAQNLVANRPRANDRAISI